MPIPAGPWEEVGVAVEILNHSLPSPYVARFVKQSRELVSSEANPTAVTIDGSVSFAMSTEEWAFLLRRSQAYGVVLLDSFDIPLQLGTPEAWSGCRAQPDSTFGACTPTPEPAFIQNIEPATLEWEGCD